MLACESLRRAGRQHPKRIVCGRRGTERKEEPRGLQITDSRETAEQPFLDRAFAAELTAHESCTPQRCTQHQQPLLVSGQGPSACADRVRAPTGWRRARSLGSSCTCCIPYAGLALVQANARIAPQRVFQGPVQFPGAFRCRHDVRVVHKGNSSPGLSDRRISPRGPPLANGARCPCHDRSMVGAGSAASRAGRSPTAELLPSSGLARSFDLRRACSAVLPARMGALLPLLGVVMRWSHPIVGVCWAHWVAQRSSPPAWTAAAEEILRCVGAIKILTDLTRSELHFKQDSKFVLAWLSLCFQHEQPRSLRTPPPAPCLSAADAFADKHRMGIGGWLSTATDFVWYSEIFSDKEVLLCNIAR
eukprot:s2578_g14.t1